MRSRKHTSTVVVLAALLSLALASSSQAGPPVPEPFEGFAVFVATGLYDPEEPHPDGIPGCTGMFCDGEYFQTEIMGRTDGEIAAKEAEAVQFFVDRFGMDANDAANDDRLLLIHFMFDPRNHYRAYLIGGPSAPSEGYVIRDGGWQLVVVDPDGFTLGGDFDGMHVPFGTAVAQGEYNIEVTRRDGTPQRELIFGYQSSEPSITQVSGKTGFSCELFSDRFDSAGVALGTFAPIFLDDGRVKQVVRNVLTFSALGDPEP